MYRELGLMAFYMEATEANLGSRAAANEPEFTALKPATSRFDFSIKSQQYLDTRSNRQPRYIALNMRIVISENI